MYPVGVEGVSVRYVTLLDGLKVRVIESGPLTGDAVLLLHGWGASVYSYSETLPALTDAGFRVTALDFPGHGLSDKPADESKYSTRALADVVMTVADTLAMRRFTLVGHSMGAAVALDIAARTEHRIERLVLISAVGLGRVPLIAPLRLLSPPLVNRITPHLLTRATLTAILHLCFTSLDRPRARDVEEYWAPTQFDGFAWACRACVHRGTWSQASATALGGLRMPVLVISGGRDLLVKSASDRGRLIPSARVVTIESGGHIVLQDCAPRTNEEILTFLLSGAEHRA